MRSAVPSTTDDARTSRFPCELIPCVRGVSDRAGSVRASRCRHARYCLALKSRVSAPRSVRSLRRGVRISRLNGQPACTPTDASPSSLRTTTHGSGPVQFAILSLLDSFIPFNSPVLTGAPAFRTPRVPIFDRRRSRRLPVVKVQKSAQPLETSESARRRRIQADLDAQMVHERALDSRVEPGLASESRTSRVTTSGIPRRIQLLAVDRGTPRRWATPGSPAW